MTRDIYFLNSKKDKWRFIIFVTLFVPAFLLIFQPFGVNNFDPKNTISSTFLLAMLGYGLVIGFSLVLFEFVIAKYIFQKKTIEWLATKWILELLFLSFTVFMYYNIMGGFHDWYFKSYISFVFNISIMALIPIAFVLLYSLNKQAQKSIVEIEKRPKIAIDNQFISLNSYNGKEKITLLLKDFLFAEAEDNYVKVYFVERHSVRTKLLRAKLSRIEDELSDFGVQRCHRSYLVNCLNVQRIVQTGSKMQLIIKMYSETIPVSKSYRAEISTFFSTHHN